MHFAGSIWHIVIMLWLLAPSSTPTAASSALSSLISPATLLTTPPLVLRTGPDGGDFFFFSCAWGGHRADFGCTPQGRTHLVGPGYDLFKVVPNGEASNACLDLRRQLVFPQA